MNNDVMRESDDIVTKLFMKNSNHGNISVMKSVENEVLFMISLGKIKKSEP